MKNRYELDKAKYAALARQTAAEGSVLLKNDNAALPLKKGEKISIFGRIQFDYYKSGTGSGGLVNAEYVVNILAALQQEADISVNEELVKVYEDWLKDHPFERGNGWGEEPWSQEEMPLDEEIVKKAAKDSDAAIVIIGRTAGEDQDTTYEKGSFLLSDLEEAMIAKVCEAFKRVIVVLNVGNIIDMKWDITYDPQAVLYVWQGGQEGGNSAADVLLGKVNPCGKLSDTIAHDIKDYPSAENFGDDYTNCYAEDIYVGYRYFETFAKEKVRYPFGYGLSYTSFALETTSFEQTDCDTTIKVKVTNTGDKAGKEVVQVYVNPAQGLLGKPLRNLVGYEKTGVIEPGQTQEITITIPEYRYASYDDSGVTGQKSSYVLEAGTYEFHVGSSVRDTKIAGERLLEKLKVLENCTEAGSSVKPFKRMKTECAADGSIACLWEDVPLRTYQNLERIANQKLDEIPYSGDQGYRLADVYEGKVSMETFIAQISDQDLCCIVRGEGMCSPKVTPGTASAFGGVTESLYQLGIPIGCCADGPSGIRMDCGTKAFSMPNGTCIACTFNKELVEDLYEVAGVELRKNRIDTLLGPGMNIHRNPLNGRNFEYFSEDPYLTGSLAAAELRGMHKYGVTGTIKHFAANNQEYHRRLFDSIMSERALREIYLKGFEIAVKEGGAYMIMSTYGAINGLWTASNYDILTQILRKEWGFSGLVMTDWWADMNEEGEKQSTQNTAAMVRCQNDIFMVVSNAAENSNHDNSEESLKNGTLTRAALQRSAMNICRVLMKTPAMERMMGTTSKEELAAAEQAKKEDGIDFDMEYHDIGEEAQIDLSNLHIERGTTAVYGMNFKEFGRYELILDVRSEAGEVAQIPISAFLNSDLIGTVTINGTGGEWKAVRQEFVSTLSANSYMKLYFAQGGLEAKTLRFRLIERMERPYSHME